MSLLLGLMTAGLLQSANAPLPPQGWVWALYDNAGPVVVLAEEVPDTPHLRTTWECTQGSGQVRLTRYQPGSLASGAAKLSAGSAQQDTSLSVDSQRLTLSLRIDSPVGQNLVSSGRLALTQDEQTTEIRFARQGLPHLRRFAELCNG